MIYLRLVMLIAVIHFALSAPRVAFAQAASFEPQFEQQGDSSYPSRVSHRQGTPQKPLIERPGDRNVSSKPAPRYAQTDSVRAGCAQSISRWATPSLNAKYTAGYAGGGTLWNSPHSRPRNQQEGTWGLDFTLWGQPKAAWLRWNDGSHRQSNGNFETDR